MLFVWALALPLHSRSAWAGRHDARVGVAVAHGEVRAGDLMGAASTAGFWFFTEAPWCADSGKCTWRAVGIILYIYP